MKRFLSALLICSLFMSTSFASGKIQGADVKSVAELVAAGATKAQLIDDTKIYLGANGINDTLNQAIVNGLIGGSGGAGGLLVNPDFELPAIGASWITTNGTSAINTTLANVYSGKQSISITPTNTSSVLSVIQTVSTNAGLVGTQGVISIAMLIPSIQTNIQICPGVDTVELTSLCVNGINNGVYRTYNIPFIYGSTSAFIKIKSNGNSVSTTPYYADYAGMTLGIIAGAISSSNTNANATAYTPTLTGAALTTNEGMFYEINGAKMHIYGTLLVGTTNGSAVSFTIPSGYTIDSSKLSATNIQTNRVGDLTRINSAATYSTASYGPYPIFTDTGTSTSILYVGNGSGASSFNKTIGTTLLVTGDRMRIDATFPLVGYSNLFQMNATLASYTADNAQFSARAHASATSISGSLATVVWTTEDYDNASALTSGVYTCPSAGKYQVNASVQVSGTVVLNSTIDLQVQKNGSAVSEDQEFAGGATTDQVAHVSDVIDCAVNDTIRVQLSSSATGPAITASGTKNYFSIQRVGL